MPKKTFIILSAAFFINSCADEKSAFQKAVDEQLQRYPAMQIQDLYKLVYQATMGNEHLMTDSAAAHGYLIHELESIQASAAAPLLEEISPDGEVVRLNLRPFKARHGDHRVLFQAMLQTARTFQKSPEQLERHLRELEKTAPFDAVKMQAYFREMREQNYPATHHSAAYEEKYKPAYRVLLKKFVPGGLSLRLP